MSSAKYFWRGLSQKAGDNRSWRNFFGCQAFAEGIVARISLSPLAGDECRDCITVETACGEDRLRACAVRLPGAQRHGRHPEIWRFAHARARIAQHHLCVSQKLGKVVKPHGRQNAEPVFRQPVDFLQDLLRARIVVRHDHDEIFPRFLQGRENRPRLLADRIGFGGHRMENADPVIVRGDLVAVQNLSQRNAGRACHGCPVPASR